MMVQTVGRSETCVFPEPQVQLPAGVRPVRVAP